MRHPYANRGVAAQPTTLPLRPDRPRNQRYVSCAALPYTVAGTLTGPEKLRAERVVSALSDALIILCRASSHLGAPAFYPTLLTYNRRQTSTPPITQSIVQGALLLTRRVQPDR